MKNYILILIGFYLFSININAQSDISSPYSVYGIGMQTPNYFSGLAAMGNTGIAYSSPFNINKTNPASLTSIPKSSFLYEVGFNNTFSTKKTNNSSQQNTDFNFTHIAMALTANDYWSTSFGIMPYTKVNYQIDVLQPVEGTTAYYNTNVIGSGGINELFWSHGFKLSNNLSVGIELLGRFGSTIQEQFISLSSSEAYIKKTNNYFSAGLNAGLQYSLKDLLGHNTTIGATASLPSTFRGEETIISSKNDISISEEYDDNSEDFDTPLKLGIGISSKINNNLLFSIDYRKNYWSSTNNSNTAVNYIDQTIYALGVEFKPSNEFSDYWNKVKYKAGINYDSGYINLSDNNIDTYTFSLGLGMPISKNGLSTMNINYSYGKEGTINNELVQDNFHKLSLNLSLFGNWFKKEKIF